MKIGHCISLDCYSKLNLYTHVHYWNVWNYNYNEFDKTKVVGINV